MRRHGAAERGYDWAWQKNKAAVLRLMKEATRNPFCRYCETARATTLDHAIPPTRMGPVGSAAYQKWFADQRFWIPCCGADGNGCNTLKGNRMPDELLPWMRARLDAVLAERQVSLCKALRRNSEAR